MLQSVVVLTSGESDLYRAAREIKFGELHNVDVSGTPVVNVTMAHHEAEIFAKIRELGVAMLDSVVVHNGLPMSGQITGVIHGLSYIRKIRFTE